MADITAPNLTPEDLNAIQQAQAGAGQPAGQTAGQTDPNATAGQPNAQPAPQGQPMLQGQPAPQGQPAGTQPSPDDIEMAKKLLGLDQLQQQAQEAQQKLRELEIERTKAQIAQKYPNVPIDLVEKEIEKIGQVNPQFAESMQTNPMLMDIAVKSVLASVKPQDKPDTITQGNGSANTSPEDDLTNKVKKGQVDEVGLGAYILNQNN